MIDVLIHLQDPRKFFLLNLQDYLQNESKRLQDLARLISCKILVRILELLHKLARFLQVSNSLITRETLVLCHSNNFVVCAKRMFAQRIDTRQPGKGLHKSFTAMKNFKCFFIFWQIFLRRISETIGLIIIRFCWTVFQRSIFS